MATKDYDIFEHEQVLMSCWNIIDELKILSRGVLEQGLSTDQITNILNGLTELYDLKFVALNDNFERSIRQ